MVAHDPPPQPKRPMSPQQKLARQIGAHESWARTDDRAARTAPARKAALERFERQVDPDGTLEPAERARRAEHARRAYFLRLALKSAQARRARAGKSTVGGGAAGG